MEDIIEGEGLAYIAGYVAYRFRLKYPFLGDHTRNVEFSPEKPSWILTLSDGYLMYPCDDLLEAAFMMNNNFNDFHGPVYLSESKFIFRTLTKLVMRNLPKDSCVTEDVMLCLVRTRSYIRVREINKKLLSDAKNKRAKKIAKFQY